MISWSKNIQVWIRIWSRNSNYKLIISDNSFVHRIQFSSIVSFANFIYKLGKISTWCKISMLARIIRRSNIWLERTTKLEVLIVRVCYYYLSFSWLKLIHELAYGVCTFCFESYPILKRCRGTITTSNTHIVDKKSIIQSINFSILFVFI